MTTTFAVFGAGAVGCWVGGMLAVGGAEVTLIGRARVMGELVGGLTVSALDRVPRTVRPTLATEVSAAATADVVLVGVKSAQTTEAAAARARVLPARTVVISLQNGLRNTMRPDEGGRIDGQGGAVARPRVEADAATPCEQRSAPDACPDPPHVLDHNIAMAWVWGADRTGRGVPPPGPSARAAPSAR